MKNTLLTLNAIDVLGANEMGKIKGGSGSSGDVLNPILNITVNDPELLTGGNGDVDCPDL